METGKYLIDVTDRVIFDVFRRISGHAADSIQRVCERYGQDEDDVRYFDVYITVYSGEKRVLKFTSEREAGNYEKYLCGTFLPAPQFYGKVTEDGGVWILIDFIPGADLSDMTDGLAVSAAESLVKIQNRYWTDVPGEDTVRFDEYWKRINKRYDYIKNTPVNWGRLCRFP